MGILHMQHEEVLSRAQAKQKEMIEASLQLQQQPGVSDFVCCLHSYLCEKLECAFMSLYIQEPELVWTNKHAGKIQYVRFSGVELGKSPYEDKVILTSEGIVSTVFDQKKPINITQMDRNDMYNPRVDRPLGAQGRIENMLAVPVLPPGFPDPIAVVLLFNKLTGIPF